LCYTKDKLKVEVGGVGFKEVVASSRQYRL
jgi:hypothetical protein